MSAFSSELNTKKILTKEFRSFSLDWSGIIFSLQVAGVLCKAMLPLVPISSAGFLTFFFFFFSSYPYVKMLDELKERQNWNQNLGHWSAFLASSTVDKENWEGSDCCLLALIDRAIAFLQFCRWGHHAECNFWDRWWNWNRQQRTDGQWEVPE